MSSNIQKYTYDKATSILRVKYIQSDKTYCYPGITQDQFNLLGLNSSLGKAIKELVKDKEFFTE